MRIINLKTEFTLFHKIGNRINYMKVNSIITVNVYKEVIIIQMVINLPDHLVKKMGIPQKGRLISQMDSHFLLAN